MFEQGRLSAPAVLRRRARRRCPRRDLDAADGPTRARRTSRPGSRQQVVDRFGARARAFEGGLKITTTLDVDLQKAAENAVNALTARTRTGRRAALVAIDNDTGEVRAMVGGATTTRAPFNLATQGQRQPGSAFKPFVLAEALRRGISPARCGRRRKRDVQRPGRQRASFVVNNYERQLLGHRTRSRGALTASDNSVFAAVGLQVGHEADRPARAADGHPHAGLDATWR